MRFYEWICICRAIRWNSYVSLRSWDVSNHKSLAKESTCYKLVEFLNLFCQDFHPPSAWLLPLPRNIFPFKIAKFISIDAFYFNNSISSFSFFSAISFQSIIMYQSLIIQTSAKLYHFFTDSIWCNFIYICWLPFKYMELR